MKTDLTAKKFLFNRYNKYFPPAKSFKDIELTTSVNIGRVAKLMEEYHKEKLKRLT